jgi:2-dehydropantoate 2-reductase
LLNKEKRKMNILILGAGGVGGYFGGRLIEAGADITYLVREKRQQSLRENGLNIESPHGNMALEVKTVTAQTVRPDFDLILLAPKAYDLEASLASLENAVGKNAVFLPFLNGMAHLRRLDEQYGAQRVMGGVAHIAAELTEADVVRQLTPMHSLTIGHRDPAHESVARDFFSLCQRANFDSFYSENIQEALWTKWAFLAALAGSTTMYRGSVGRIIATNHGNELIRAMYAECLSVAQAYESPVPVDAQEKALKMLTQPDSPLTASMLRDLLSGRRTEHDHVLGDMVRMAKIKKLSVALLAASYCHMQVETGY